MKDAPVAAAPDTWSGFSVGVGVGAGTFKDDIWADATRKDFLKEKKCFWWWCFTKFHKSNEEMDGHFSEDEWKIFGTAQIAYDRLIHDRFLIGAFADFDFYPDADDSFSQTTKFKHSTGTLSGDVSRDGIWTIGGRLGYLVTPRLLLYGLGGYSQMNLSGEVNASFDDPFYTPHPIPTSMTLQLPDHLNGYTFGGGFETKLDRIDKRLSLKVEYRYSHFDGENASASESLYREFIDCGWFSKTDTKHWVKDNLKVAVDDTDVQSVRAVLVWKLTADAAPIVPLK